MSALHPKAGNRSVQLESVRAICRPISTLPASLRFASQYISSNRGPRRKGMSMAEKQTDADKAEAMREYREKHDAAMRRIATLRAARLARDAALSTSDTPKSKRRS